MENTPTKQITVARSILYKELMYLGLNEEDFLKIYHPPCEKCLIQNMCIADADVAAYNEYVPFYRTVHKCILVKACKYLRDFMIDNKHFDYLIDDNILKGETDD